MYEPVIVIPTFDVAHTHRQCRATLYPKFSTKIISEKWGDQVGEPKFNLKKAVEAWYRPILGGIFASRL